MARHRKPNLNRCLATEGSVPRERLDEMAREARYSGNPLHKRSRGDFGLVPPAAARIGKSLCDSVKIFKKREALAPLRDGLRRGAISDRQVHGRPNLVWTVTKNGEVLEARRDADGSYHGHPMDERDPIREHVLTLWRTTDD